MANINNDFFSVFRKNKFLAVFRDFFADVSKKRKTRYLKNGCINFLDFSIVLVTANMNNEFFSVLRKNRFLAVFREFFADVSKNFKTRYLKNRSSDEAHLLTQVSYNK